MNHELQTIPRPERGELYCDPDHKHWRIDRVFKKSARLRQADWAGRDSVKLIPIADMAGWMKAEIPRTVKKGQTLFCGEERCVVTGFTNTQPLFVKVEGLFGFKTKIENWIPASLDQFACYGLRLPFPHEVNEQ